jgi:hypothetical protein
MVTGKNKPFNRPLSAIGWNDFHRSSSTHTLEPFDAAAGR